MGSQAAPALFSLPSHTAAAGGPGLMEATAAQALPKYNPILRGSPVWSPSVKAVSEARQDHGAVIQVDETAQKETMEYAAMLVGMFLDMRRELLALVRRPDLVIISPLQTSLKAVGITQEQLLGEANKIAFKYSDLMNRGSIEPLLDAYLNGKSGAAMDLQTSVRFSTDDWNSLEELRSAWVNTSIKTFSEDQVVIIEEALKSVADSPDLTTFRNRVEDAMEKNLWREQYKLDRIARTSLNRVSNHSRGEQYREIARETDPEVTLITAQDARVRPAHALLHGQSMKLSEALTVIDSSINCRCRIVRTMAQLPQGIPKPEDLVKDIKEEQTRSREEALARYKEALL